MRANALEVGGAERLGSGASGAAGAFFSLRAIRRAGPSTHQRASHNFFSYQQLLRIATQLTTQHPHHIDIQGVFPSTHSPRNGVTACFELSPVSMTF
jgi:hypothetical protein